MLATSAALGDPALVDQLRSVLKYYKFAVIHFNNGLHWVSTEEEYQEHFLEFLKVFERGADAKLIWATSTPMRTAAPNLREFHADNARVKARNKIVLELAAKEGIPVDDLYSLVENHPEWIADGVHYKPRGSRRGRKWPRGSSIAWPSDRR